MSNYPYQIPSELSENEDGVIQVFTNTCRGVGRNQSTFRVRTGIETIGHFLEKVRQALHTGQNAFREKIASELGADSRNTPYSWFDQGVECELLKLGSSEWQKGRLKIHVSIEFCPDEPEEKEDFSEEANLSFPLDEIRREELHY